MKTYSRVYFLLCLFFGDFKEVANSAKIFLIQNLAGVTIFWPSI